MRNEVNILRGILTAVQQRRRRAGARRRSGRCVSTPLYLDYAATTPVDPRVAAAMSECLTRAGVFGNPASQHALRPRGARAGRAGARTGGGADRRARAGADLDLGCHRVQQPGDSRYRARGRAAARAGRATSSPRALEHKAVLDPCRRLEQEGCRGHLPEAGRAGSASTPSRCARRSAPIPCWSRSCTPIMRSACCRTSTPSARYCRARGVPLHVDAAQSAGKIAIDVGALAGGSAVASRRTSSTVPRASARCT